MNKQQKAFTLVELIVVVTILAILSTIGFVSYSSYLIGVRDTNRISNMKAISDGLEMYKTKFYLPLPEDKIEIKANDILIARQGYAGANVLESIEFSNGGKDPKDDIYYSYYLTKNKRYFQLMGFLEEEENLQTNLFNQANAIDYSIRYPTVYGKKLGILTGTGEYLNTPIQEISSIVSSGSLDVATTTDDYIAHLTDVINVSGPGVVLGDLEEVASVGGKGWSASGGVLIYVDLNSLSLDSSSSDSSSSDSSSSEVLTFIKQIPNPNSTESAEESLTNNSVILNSSDIELVDDVGDNGLQIVGLRFTEINIPQNATIVSAKIKFEVDEYSTDTTNLIFQLENNVNPATFDATIAGNVTDRTKFSTQVNWDNVSTWATEWDIHYSPDLSTIVQEIINNSSWNSGNPIVFIISGTGERVAKPNPTLEVEYTVD